MGPILTRLFAAIVLSATIALPATALDHHQPGPRYAYGYNAYEHHYGPIQAQHELEWLTHQPGIRGVDYGYGLDYFLGSGPSYHYKHGPRVWRWR